MSPTRNYIGHVPPRDGLVCALCRSSGALTKAHVPPRTAGNRGVLARAQRPFIRDRVRQWDTPRDGGLWFRTICRDCNTLASKYDGAYGDFARAILPHISRYPLYVPKQNRVPPIAVAPGRVARSVLHGMVAMAPSMFVMHPTFIRDLQQDGDNLRLPAGLQLRVATTTDTHVRVASSYSYHAVLSRRLDYVALAEIYFRPFVWLLTSDRSLYPPLADEENWGNATDWIIYSKECYRTDLRDVLKSLPPTRHPSRRGNYDEWMELGGDTSYVLEGTLHDT